MSIEEEDMDEARSTADLAALLAEALHNEVIGCKWDDETEFAGCPGPSFHASDGRLLARSSALAPLRAAVRPAEPEPLDVERLARAIFHAERPDRHWPTWDEYLSSFAHGPTQADVWLRKAERVAAEYAHLSEPAQRRMWTALQVAAHEPYDQLGEPDFGFPVCSVCGAIQVRDDGTDRCDWCQRPRKDHVGEEADCPTPEHTRFWPATDQ